MTRRRSKARIAPMTPPAIAPGLGPEDVLSWFGGVTMPVVDDAALDVAGGDCDSV